MWCGGGVDNSENDVKRRRCTDIFWDSDIYRHTHIYWTKKKQRKREIQCEDR